ncbi:hypothetical protein GCM10008985_32870 [Halococcus dombrowskii]|uniref:Uncharacterized protein n=2 Tax=Halococcus dombrowskii TaxID=179637 RepID=A0AAV3SKM6_HALDO
MGVVLGLEALADQRVALARALEPCKPGMECRREAFHSSGSRDVEAEHVRERGASGMTVVVGGASVAEPEAFNRAAIHRLHMTRTHDAGSFSTAGAWALRPRRPGL